EELRLHALVLFLRERLALVGGVEVLELLAERRRSERLVDRRTSAELQAETARERCAHRPGQEKYRAHAVSPHRVKARCSPSLPSWRFLRSSTVFFACAAS